jgi:fatty acid desaturase
MLSPSILVILSAVYLLYFWIAKDEMKRKMRVKRIIWLVFIPVSYPVAALTLFAAGWGELALIVALPVWLLSIVILATIGEIAEACINYHQKQEKT